MILAALVVGCKSGDSSASTTPDTSKPADATATDTTKPADTTADASKTGASGGNSVVGSWTTDDKTMTDQNVEFKEDGTVSGTATLSEPKGATIELGMTYKIDGDTMTEKPVSMKMTAPPDADEATKKAIDQQNKLATPEAAAKQPEQVDTIKWVDKDTFTLTGKDGKATTFKRKS